MAVGAVLRCALGAGWRRLWRAGRTPVQRSYIDPFPSGDRYRVVVLGDSLGEGLWSGLYRAFQEDAKMEFIQRAKPSTRVRAHRLLRLEQAGRRAPQGGDLPDRHRDVRRQRQPGDQGGKEWLKVGSEEWDDVYGKRVEAFIKKLRAANVAVYWVGLPIMRSPGQNSDAEALNEVYREKAFINGAKFIDTWSGFTDEGRPLQRLRPRHVRSGQAAPGR